MLSALSSGMKCLQMHYPESVSKKEFQNGNVKVKEYIFDLNGDSVLTISKSSEFHAIKIMKSFSVLCIEFYDLLMDNYCVCKPPTWLKKIFFAKMKFAIQMRDNIIK